ncbi:(-)-germacrene D synthase-like isoform X1 [Syzygium oleosum]|uniref:(-)-germacrene D synthase-like isoform X1 n=1 Tax=Syzygium oleosum TaxID=219896 RepID=UPI0024B87FA0|nr:(-)-germacrene D synthase-like isoform X1 [Syzygium oleosum]
MAGNMSVQVSTIPSSPPSKGRSGGVERRCAEYHESIWGDYFLKYASPSNSTKFKFLGRVEEQVEELKGKVRKMLIDVVDKPSQMLHLIDEIQRLGIDYHFEREIDEQLEQIHKSYSQPDHGDFMGDDLHMVALMFRLLRQQGFNISSEVFNKFKDSEGKFRESLIIDVRGLLSLYEACHLRCHGDALLEEALPFAITHLESIDEMKVSTSLAKQASRALNQPLRKGLPRLEARHYISLYQEEPSHDEVLLLLAKLDFNLLQEQHQKEIGKITRWWKDIDVARKFPFARDRIVELFFWMVGAYFQPEFAVARDILTRVTALISILDDIYDVYGTLEELVLYTEAIEKWDVDAMDGLPEYMQAHYKELLDLYDEIGNELATKGRSYRLVYAREAMKKQARWYFREAKWFHLGYTPTMEEYMPLALLTTGYEALSITTFVGMGDVVTKDAFEWSLGDCKILKASQIICRFMDDIASHQLEQKRGHVASSVELLMKENAISEQEAEGELQKRVDDAWKDINEEFLRPTAVPTPVLMPILNLSRVIDVLYTDGDHYTRSKTKLKDHIISLFVSPLPM